MARTIRFLGVHGLGDHRNSTWMTEWKEAVTAAFGRAVDAEFEFEFLSYDEIFAQTELSAWDTAQALWKLTSSAASSVVRRRGVIGDVSDRVRWTAGYVVAWVQDEQFKQQTRELVLDKVASYKPDVLMAHSLGSLVTYNALSHVETKDRLDSATRKRIHYVTLGSQLGNPFVLRNLTPGRIEPLDIGYWNHLFNKEDDVFTAAIRLPAAHNFQQVLTPFDIEGVADHSAVEYLKHQATVSNVWQPLSNAFSTPTGKRSLGTARLVKSKRKPPKAKGRQGNRALVVGIDNYPLAADRLEGCVNDAYLMSSVLQERGFQAEDIRLCLDKRATAKGILERMEWLVDEISPEDQRVLYFSGHGATIPEYGERNEPDRLCETLVPWDFDWSGETAITDDQIYAFYSQLPYNSRLTLIFDCCHSGGMHRDSASSVRAITPPDDIRHRSLRWDVATQMWVQRDFKRITKGFSDKPSVNRDYFGSSGAVARLGRASMLRGTNNAEYTKLREKVVGKPVGPYLPLIIQACQEDELASEYRHGATSYGAFTYSFATILRRNKNLTFSQLIERTTAQLKELKYDQRPQLLGPDKVTGSKVSWPHR